MHVAPDTSGAPSQGRRALFCQWYLTGAHAPLQCCTRSSLARVHLRATSLRVQGECCQCDTTMPILYTVIVSRLFPVPIIAPKHSAFMPNAIPWPLVRGPSGLFCSLCRSSWTWTSPVRMSSWTSPSRRSPAPMAAVVLMPSTMPGPVASRVPSPP